MKGAIRRGTSHGGAIIVFGALIKAFANSAQRMNGLVRKAGALPLWALVLFLCPILLSAQTDDPFSVRVESNLVVIRAEVVYKRFVNGQPPGPYANCVQAEDDEFHAIAKVPSKPYFPRDCSSWLVRNLSNDDFRIFEDGVEQKIQSVKVETRTNVTSRDNLGWHEDWSHTPKGKWSSADEVSEPDDLYTGYSLSYVPSISSKGECHRIEITVGRAEAVVFAPKQYCYINHPPTHPLEGSSFGKQLEANLGSAQNSSIPLAASGSFVYDNWHSARVGIVLEFPWKYLTHKWTRGDLQATVGVFGEVINKNHIVTARFSDSAFGGLPIGPHAGYMPGINYELRDPVWLPSRYETQIELLPGEYELRVILSDGEQFGRATIPITIDDYDRKQLALSSVVLFKRFRNADAAAKEAAYVDLAPEFVPLVSQDVQITPAADTNFSSKQEVPAYFEVYEPLLAQQPTIAVEAHMRIVSKATGTAYDFPWFDAMPYRRHGTTSFAIHKELTVDGLQKGEYQVEVQAKDSAGRKTPWRTAAFTLK